MPESAKDGQDADRASGVGRRLDLPIDDIPEGRAVTNVALVSGGMDSTVAAAVSCEVADIDVLAYLDTGTGVTDNEEYTRDLARSLGVMPVTLGTPEDYEERVKEHGFPGPAQHGMQYVLLKERQIQKLYALTEGPLVLWTGVRSDESERRLRNVDRVETVGRGWTWVAPIHDWTKNDCEAFLDERDLPRNPLWDTLGRSGDCFCGCFGNPEEKLDLEAAGQADHAGWLRNLETEVETGDKTETWAWGAFSDKEQRAEDAKNDTGQMTLCSTCGVSLPATDGGQTIE